MSAATWKWWRSSLSRTPLAHYAYTRLLTVRPDVQLFTGGASGEIEDILSMTGEDVCLVFLFHRYTYTQVRIPVEMVDTAIARQQEMMADFQ